MAIDVNKMKSYKKNVDTEVNQFLNSSDEDKAKSYSSLSPELKALIDPIIQEEQAQQSAPKQEAPAPTQAPVQEAPTASLDNPLYNYPDKAEIDSKLFLSMPMEQQTANYANLPADTKALVESKLSQQQSKIAAQAPLTSLKPAQEEVANAQAPQKSTSSVGFDPNALMNQSLIAGSNAINQQKELANAQTSINEDKFKQQEEAILARQTEMKEKLQAYENNYKEKEIKIENTMNELLNTKLDQNRIFKNRTTNQRVMTGLGVFLGALSNALTGQTDVSKNPALMAIDKAIENDIRAQELEMANKKDSIGLMTNDLSRLTQLFGSQETAAQALYALNQEAIGKNIERLQLKNAGLANNLAANQAKEKYFGEAATRFSTIKTNMANAAKTEAETAVLRNTPKATEATKAFEKEMGTSIADWTQTRQFVMGDIAKLKEIKSRLQGDENLTGGGFTLLPDAVAQKSASVRDDVESVIQKNLKLILGAAFGQKEGADFLKRGYNQNVDEKYNVKKIDDLLQVMERKASELDRATEYYNNSGGNFRGLPANKTPLPSEQKVMKEKARF